MSKTEHELTSADSADALDELFDDADFDEALGDALDEADVELEISDADESADAELLDTDHMPDSDDDGDVDTVAESEPADDGEFDDDSTDAHDQLVDTAEAEPIDDDLDVESDDETEAVGELTDSGDVDQDRDADADDDDSDTDVARHGIIPAESDTDADDDFELPEIVPATDDDGAAELDDGDRPGAPRTVVPAATPVTDRDDEVDDADARELDDGELDDEVSDDILEELRRADIDGPIVDFVPQDDTGAARRRPKRSADYEPAPVPIPAQVPRVLGRKPRVRKVTRVVRHVDPWSVFKIALVANAVMYVIVLTAGVLLWNVAHATGTVDNVERFLESFGWSSFTFNGGEIYHASWIAGLFVVIGLTGLAVLAATLFNLITDLVGGMRFTVLEEEVVETRVSPMRRFVVRRPEPEVPALLHDDSGHMIREAVVDDTGANERPSR